MKKNNKTAYETQFESIFGCFVGSWWALFVSAICLAMPTGEVAVMGLCAAFFIVVFTWLSRHPAADTATRPAPTTVRINLQSPPSIGKRLDEHREVVEAIAAETALFQERPWHIRHLATQDDFLMALYHAAYGCWPEKEPGENFGVKWRLRTGEVVRPRPAILGPCGLREYAKAPEQG